MRKPYLIVRKREDSTTATSPPKSDRNRPILSENEDGLSEKASSEGRSAPRHLPQNQTETGRSCPKMRRAYPKTGNSVRKRGGVIRKGFIRRALHPRNISPKSDRNRPILSENEDGLSEKTRDFVRKRGQPAREQLLGLYMANLVGGKILSDLYMAPKTRYAEYEQRNSNVCTWDIRETVPYISHLVQSEPPNLPCISELVTHTAL